MGGDMSDPNGADASTDAERLEITELFRSLASGVLKSEFRQEVTEDSVIADLGLDSIHSLEIIGEMERELGIEVPNEDLEGLETVRQLLDVVIRARRAQR